MASLVDHVSTSAEASHDFERLAIDMCLAGQVATYAAIVGKFVHLYSGQVMDVESEISMIDVTLNKFVPVTKRTFVQVDQTGHWCNSCPTFPKVWKQPNIGPRPL